MAISIDELDILVRSFYEGRGEQVCALAPRPLLSFFCVAPRASHAHHAKSKEQRADPSPLL